MQFQDTRTCYGCNKTLTFTCIIHPSKANSTFGTLATLRVLNKVAGADENVLYLRTEVQCYHFGCKTINEFYYRFGETSMEHHSVYPTFTE